MSDARVHGNGSFVTVGDQNLVAVLFPTPTRVRQTVINNLVACLFVMALAFQWPD